VKSRPARECLALSFAAMRVACDHCGNAVFASWSNTGIIDELAKRVGWRPDNEMMPVGPVARSRKTAAEREEAAQVARELRDLGLDADEADVLDWLDEVPGGSEDRLAFLKRAPAGLEGTVRWLERAEASQAPIRREILDRLAPATAIRGDIAWQRTAEGLLACSGHCFEQLSFCLACNLPRTVPGHRSCPAYVPPCTIHGAEILPFPGATRR
jgi:hypothetical protein